MLYPLLHRLERNGYVEATWGNSETGRRRKYYRLTERGPKSCETSSGSGRLVDSALRGIWFTGSEPAHSKESEEMEDDNEHAGSNASAEWRTYLRRRQAIHAVMSTNSRTTSAIRSAPWATRASTRTRLFWSR